MIIIIAKLTTADAFIHEDNDDDRRNQEEWNPEWTQNEKKEKTKTNKWRPKSAFKRFNSILHSQNN